MSDPSHASKRARTERGPAVARGAVAIAAVGAARGGAPRLAPQESQIAASGPGSAVSQ